MGELPYPEADVLHHGASHLLRALDAQVLRTEAHRIRGKANILLFLSLPLHGEGILFKAHSTLIKAHQHLISMAESISRAEAKEQGETPEDSNPVPQVREQGENPEDSNPVPQSWTGYSWYLLTKLGSGTMTGDHMS